MIKIEIVDLQIRDREVIALELGGSLPRRRRVLFDVVCFSSQARRSPSTSGAGRALSPLDIAAVQRPLRELPPSSGESICIDFFGRV